MGASCRACKAEMLWASREEGNDIPLDPEPNPDGNYVLVALEPGRKPHVRLVRRDEHVDPAAPRYFAHPKVCPEREQAPAPRPRRDPTIDRRIDEALHDHAPDASFDYDRRDRRGGVRGNQRKRRRR